MQRVELYTVGHKVTFRPAAERPAAVVLVPDEVIIDPAKDRAYVGPIGNPTGDYRPGGMLIAARMGMFGLRVESDMPAPAGKRSRKS
jgi:hypothetical protein